jgi:hypothetical protein
MWYDSAMPNKINKSSRTKAKGLIIGRKGFEKISAVEGIRMSREMKTTFSDFDKKGTSAEARRSTIARKYGK